jgi:hypothetical protein
MLFAMTLAVGNPLYQGLSIESLHAYVVALLALWRFVRVDSILIFWHTLYGKAWLKGTWFPAPGTLVNLMLIHTESTTSICSRLFLRRSDTERFLSSTQFVEERLRDPQLRTLGSGSSWYHVIYYYTENELVASLSG